MLLAPSAALACACGCGVFDVGDDNLVPGETGRELFVEYDFLDQTQNWSGRQKAPAADNSDKRITTNFVVLGGQLTLNRDWGLMVEVPVTDRTFHTTDPGFLARFHDTSLGDIRLMGVYTGFSPDMSSGLIAGVKLPTGDFRAAGFTRDVEIGSGSTDVLLGGYHRGTIGGSPDWTYLFQALANIPVSGQDHYMPGGELDVSANVAYGGWSAGAGKVKIEPLLQVIGSFRGSDRGLEADPDNTGYARVLLSPGVQVSAGRWKLYGDVELPIYQSVKGNQLIAPEQFKVVLSRGF
ncbi:MAG TPA: hypothetical protein VKU90_04110 [Caulobacteraceae bacterium]|nr:hypothetical protein [Caulobacteraceae bacterium]